MNSFVQNAQDVVGVSCLYPYVDADCAIVGRCVVYTDQKPQLSEASP